MLWKSFLGLILIFAWIPQAAAQINDDPAPACSGPCVGYSLGFAFSPHKCEDLTPTALQELKDSACEESTKDDARSKANDQCKDGSGNCLCAGGSFSGPHASANTIFSSCYATCETTYLGSCQIVRMPSATGEMASFLNTLETEPMTLCSR